MTREVTQESFLKDVAKHELTIVRDNGVHRHVRMKKPQSGDMYFDIVTYPHFLVYSGDMGCFVFSRIDDMFQFFRSGLREEGKLLINEGYWAEKLEATDRADGHKRYSADKFREYVRGKIKEFDEALLDGEEKADEDEVEEHSEARAIFTNRLEELVLSYADDEYPARVALTDFEWNGRRPFQDSWEVSFDEYTFRFVWCLYAIVWTIREYDRARAAGRVGVDR